MSRSVRLIEEANDLPAMHAILTICGEDMHRNKGLNHWYPFRPFDYFKEEVAEASVYAIFEDDLLVGTFYLIDKPRPYYQPERWANPEAKALYLGGFGILPFVQGRGMGAWAMREVDRIAQENGGEALRFDGVSYNEALMRFYNKLGYQECGLLETQLNPLMLFEKVFGEAT